MDCFARLQNIRLVKPADLRHRPVVSVFYKLYDWRPTLHHPDLVAQMQINGRGANLIGSERFDDDSAGCHFMKNNVTGQNHRHSTQ